MIYHQTKTDLWTGQSFISSKSIAWKHIFRMIVLLFHNQDSLHCFYFCDRSPLVNTIQKNLKGQRPHECLLPIRFPHYARMQASLRYKLHYFLFTFHIPTAPFLVVVWFSGESSQARPFKNVVNPSEVAADQVKTVGKCQK